MNEKYLVFTIQKKLYALPSAIIGEVAALERVFPLPLVPGYVKGLINRYSVPYALIDISLLLFNETSGSKKIIVLKEEIDKLALLIDDVTDIADPDTQKIMKIEQETSMAGLVNSYFEWKDGQVFCIDAAEIISRIKRDFEQEP
ncbi:MAG: chemotaxis protein CheW [Treponema sp.]|nr:chemotaxis protein CheW [Treponema sp.]